MKWILAILLLVSATAIGQVDDTTKYISYPTQYGMKVPRMWAPTTMIMPSGDTTGKRPGKIGAFMTHLGDGNVYRWNGSNWVAFGGGSSLTLTNIGTGYALVATPGGNIKRINNSYGILIDSTTTANTITIQADTSSTNHVVTQSDLNDGLATKQNSGNYITALTGDVTASGPGSAAATIANNAVTTAKINNAAVTQAKVAITGTPDGTKFLKDDFSWGTPAGGSGQTLYSDLGQLPVIQIYSPAKGVASSANVSGYSHTAVDSARMYFTSGGVTGDKGGWLANGTSGDSIRVTVPYWIIFSNSIGEGHGGPTALHGRLHPAGVATFQWDYANALGGMAYRLEQLMQMPVYNHGIGGQTSVDGRKRAFRDMLSQYSPNSTDGRGDQTLFRLGQGVILEFAINDIFNGVPLQDLKDNIEWMAAMCQQYGLRCVVLNCPGDAVANQDQLRKIADFNYWCASGALNPYMVRVVDINRKWNDLTFGRDNIHKAADIYDDIHWTTNGGYDSLASFVFTEAKLPVLRKAVFINQLDPGGFSGYSRPTGITINSVPYTLSSASDTINITSFVPDSVWIKITASTNVSGTTYTGFSHIEWYVDNNPTNLSYYTQRTHFGAGFKPYMTLSKLRMSPPTAENGYDIIKVQLADLSTTAFKVTTYAGGTRQFLGGDNIYNSAALNITASGTAIGTGGSIYSEGASSQIAALQLLINGDASNTGVGISVGNTASSFRLQSNPSAGKDQFRFDAYSGGNTALGSDPTNLVAITRMGFGNSGGNDQRANSLSITPTINHNTSANSGVIIRGLYYKPTITNLGNARHNGIVQASGNNYLNETSDSTCFGCAESAAINAKLRINGSMRFDIGSDATGDIYYRNSSGLFTRLGIGSNGDVLTLASGLPSWAAPSGGSGITSINSDAGPAYTIQGSTGIDVVNTTGTATIAFRTNDPWVPHILYKQYSDASNTTTLETGLYGYSLPANTLGTDGQSIHFETSGTFTDASATVALQIYFAGTSFANTSAQTLSAAGSWCARGYIIRTSSSTARAYAVITSDKIPDKSYVFTLTLTGIDWTDANVLTFTGQAGGGGGGSDDITQTSIVVTYEPITL